MTARQNGMALVRGIALVLLAVVLAAWLMFESVQRHLSRACVIRDTVYLGLCPSSEAQLSSARLKILLQRIKNAPGDSRAYIELAILARSPDAPTGLNAVKVLDTAVSLAPHDKDVLRMRARSAAEAKDWKVMAEYLVELAEAYYDTEAAGALARLIAFGNGASLLHGYVQHDSRWLLLVLDMVPIEGVPLAPMVPLLMVGYEIGAVPMSAMMSAIKNLKHSNNWTDAYALWGVVQKQSLGPLYNSGFDRPLQTDAFDWEINPLNGGRGALAQRMRLPHRGYVLGVQYTGRSIGAVPARQVLFIYPGKYQLQMQYMTDRLRSEQGLAWVIRCTSTQALLGQSPGILDTRRTWQTLKFEFEVPENCLPVVNLQLETSASYEAVAGFTGKAYFDEMNLQRLMTK